LFHNGEKLFKQRCLQCHVAEAGAGNKTGPNLHGLIGRSTGSVPDYNYTSANKNAGVVWSDTTLFQYLENPKKFIPNTKMAFPGFKSPQDRADVIAYLKVATK